MIGCQCAVCRSEDPKDKRMRSSIYVETPELAWVVDTGPDFRAQCLRESICRLDAVIYTHSHTDHMMGFDDLRPFCFPDRLMPIYAGKETMADLKRVFEFAFNGENLIPGYVRPEPHLIEGSFSLGATLVTPLPVRHGRAKVHGFLFERGGEMLAAYLSDCKVVPQEVMERIQGVQVLIVDALRHKLHPTHMNIQEALAVVAQVEPGRTLFTHLCHELAHEETERTLPEGVNIAYDGLKLVF